MEARPQKTARKQGVSIITCTKRRECMRNLSANYSRQSHRNKELIILLDHDSLNMNEYAAAAQSYSDVRNYRTPGHVTLGSCLNYGIKLVRYGLIAKFDDDDYYAPGYLKESLRSMRKSNADIVGKRAHHMYLQGRNKLLLRDPKLGNQYVHMVQGVYSTSLPSAGETLRITPGS